MWRQASPVLKAFDPCHTERFRVCHNVGLNDRNKIINSEILSDFDLMFDGPLSHLAKFAGAHGLLFAG